MTIQSAHFGGFRDYLLYDQKHSDTQHNLNVLSSRFNFLQRYFEKEDFNRENFTQFIRYIREKGYQNETINNYIKLAKHLDKYLKINELQDYTYFPKIQKPKEVLTAKQIQQMADYEYPYDRQTQEKNLCYRAVIYTMFFTGARINEVLDLRWEDLQSDPVPLLVLNQTKNNELRYAPIPKFLYEKLQHLPRYSGYIFSTPAGKRLTRQTVSEDLKRRAKAIGVSSDVYNHIIRHSFINFMLKNGAKLHEVSRMVGHKSIETTNKYYVHTMIEELSSMLHLHHPYLKNHQTLDIILEKGRAILSEFLDMDKFHLQVTRHNKKIRFEIREVKDL